MRFRAVNSVAIAACEEAAKFMAGIAEQAVFDVWSMEYNRSIAQNKKLWPCLGDIAKSVDWFGKKHDAETWKHIISAAWRSQEFVYGIGNTLVVLPVRTSKMRKAEFAELLTYIQAFGDEHGVKWSDPALEVYATYREAS